jgi:hypothetical protein
VPSSEVALSERDRQLVRAAAVLAAGWFLALAGEILHLGTVLDESGVATSILTSHVLGVLSRLPALVAVALGLAAFRGEGAVRRSRLRRAFLFAFAAFGLDFVSRLLDFAALEPSSPHGFGAGLAAGFLGAFWLAGASLFSASAFSITNDPEAREARLGLAGFMAAAGFLLSAISAFELAVAYANYRHHNDFVGGLVLQGLGGAAAAVALLIAATAFRRRATDAPRGTPAAGSREHRLFIAALVFALASIVIAVGEAQMAEGTTAIGYAKSIAVADWTSALSRCLSAGAGVCAALGFKQAAGQPD